MAMLEVLRWSYCESLSRVSRYEPSTLRVSFSGRCLDGACSVALGFCRAMPRIVPNVRGEWGGKAPRAARSDTHPSSLSCRVFFACTRLRGDKSSWAEPSTPVSAVRRFHPRLLTRFSNRQFRSALHRGQARCRVPELVARAAIEAWRPRSLGQPGVGRRRRPASGEASARGKLDYANSQRQPRLVAWAPSTQRVRRGNVEGTS